MTWACSSLVSFLQVLENIIDRAAYLQGSSESMPMATTVAFEKIRNGCCAFKNYAPLMQDVLDRSQGHHIIDPVPFQL
jgi:hypothetical protein